MLLPALFVLGACGGPGSPAGTVAVSLHVDLGGDLEPAGVPVGPDGAVGVSIVELRVFGGEGELFFDGDGKVVPNGGVPVVLTGGSVTLHLPRDSYDFEVEGRDVDGHVLAVGSLHGVEITEDTSVDLPLLTLVGSVELVAPSSIVPNEIVDVHLLVHPPDRPDLLVPTTDFSVSYLVDATVIAESGLGVRFGVECQWMSVSVTVTGLADGSQVAGSLELAPNEVCSQYSGPVGVDLIPPALFVDEPPVELELGGSLTLTGTVSELQTGVASVTLFDGPVEVGIALVDTTEQPHVWSVVWTPTVAREYELFVVAADEAGNESRGSVQVSVVPAPEFGGFTSVAAGGVHTCGLASGGAAYCWGFNGSGQLGDGSTTASSEPTEVLGGLGFVALAGGDLHTCGLAPGGAAYCWGYNNYGQLGDGFVTNSSEPVEVLGGLEFVALAAGDNHTCGLAPGGAAYCWGFNYYGQLGDGSTTNSSEPVEVLGGLGFVALAAGSYQTCGLAPGGAAYCWGHNGFGQLGDGSWTNSGEPVEVLGGLGFVALAGGDYHMCGLDTDGAAYCWGHNIFGQLGDGSWTNSGEPVEVLGGLGFVALTAGFYHTCGLDTDGSAYCWGRNSSGQLGDGSTTNSDEPVEVLGGLGLVAITAGDSHMCGLAPGGAAYCWGRGTDGQLGDGSTINRTAPVRVDPPAP